MKELVHIGGVLFFTRTWYPESLVLTIPELARTVKIEGFDLEELPGLIQSGLTFTTTDYSDWFLFHRLEMECNEDSCFMCCEGCDNSMNARIRITQEDGKDV
ncbi:hypothetical protein MBAV_002745 [Candidatus Magnetobacterium bavaricum]|uniref:Uncharacterized protein n=1 Tax=Candidatus Magnetobacterium bavaricum TaxID=29290 RepID=A0A0F3GWK6_9BACT|nr:hypothetical protein MBAV_002745 [Candidatus Magnetobacterium bavaricum]